MTIKQRLAKLEPPPENDLITIIELDADPEKCRTYQRRATPEEKKLEKKNGGVIVDLGDLEDGD